MSNGEIVKLVLVERRQGVISGADGLRQPSVEPTQRSVFELRPLDLSRSGFKVFDTPRAGFDFLEEHQNRYKLAGRDVINKWFESAKFRRHANQKTVSNIVRWLDKYSGLGVEQIFYYDADTQQPIPSDQLVGPTVWIFSESGFLCPCESMDAAYSEIEKARHLVQLKSETRVAEENDGSADPRRDIKPRSWK